MSQQSKAVFGFLLIFGLFMSPLYAQSFWQGESGGYRIQWSATNLRATKPSGQGCPSFDSAEMARAWWRDKTSSSAQYNATSNAYSGEFDYRLLSAVGPIIRVEEGKACDCGGVHPSEVVGFFAYDLSENKLAKPFPASLLDYLTQLWPSQKLAAAASS